MELHSPYRLLGRSISSKLDIGCRCDALVIFGDGCDGITMAHPYLRVLDKSVEQRILGIEVLKIGASVLTRVGCLNLSTVGVRNELCAIADAKHRDASYKLAQVNLERLLIVYRIGASAEDDTDNAGVVLRELVVRHNLAEGVQFAYTAADELRGLRTEIKNNNLLLHLLYCLMINVQLLMFNY